MVTGNGLWAIDRPQATLLPDVVALATALGTAACLAGPYGEMGAALAILAGTTVATVLKTYRFLYLARELPYEP
jgi:O-antigen/teichoic acid export membrane protein